MYNDDGTSPSENQITGPSNTEEISQMNKKFVRPKDEDEVLILNLHLLVTKKNFNLESHS